MKASEEVHRQDSRVLRAFCEVAERYPERSAIVSGNSSLSYGEVRDRAALIAEELFSAGVRPGVTVGVHLSRSAALAPAVLGTWLAGGSYVPVDPEGPVGRAAYVLQDSRAHVVLTDSRGLPNTIAAPAARVVVDSTGSVIESCRPTVSAHNESISHEPEIKDLAYIIYTSGTTGRPKGVLIGHAQVAAMAKSHENALYSGVGNSPNRVALNSALTADSFFSDFVHLAYGRTLYVVDSQTRRDPEKFGRFLLDNQIEVLDATPTQLRAVLLAGQRESLAALTVLIIGGEATTPDLWSQIRALPGVQAFNMYGPTECTVAVTVGSLRSHVDPVIGTALEGCEVWVMDDQQCVVADGVSGELVVTGRQVGLGYLNPTLTDLARFVEVELPGSGQAVRGYRTGDRGCRDAAGQIVFLGRDDDQVNIGGHRVELGEVDVRVRECPGVLQAAVGLTGQDGPAILTAWIVVSPGIKTASLRAALADHLPSHMIPVLRVVPSIPMGMTGKADLAKLSSMAAAAAESHDVQAPAPADLQSLATLIRECWHEVLGAIQIDDDDDFFALGGDSLKATSMTVLLRSSLDQTLPIRIVFEHPRFGDFTAAITEWTQGHRR